MLKSLRSIFATALCVTGLAANAQTTVPHAICGTDQVHAKLMQQDPAYAQSVNGFKQYWSNYALSHSNSIILNTPNGIVYEIPVVIHVIHTGGAVGTVYNPTQGRLDSMITYVNQSFAATWTGYPTPTTGGAYVPIRFVLAKRTGNCTATNGINRVDGRVLPNYQQFGVNSNNTNGEDEIDVKALSIWSNKDYYNIWVVNKIDGEDGVSPTGSYTAGFAYYPGAPADRDGMIMIASKAKAGEITITHELGHAFNLAHTFQGATGVGAGNCPSNANCAVDGDGVCDTDPHDLDHFQCSTNPCGGTTVLRNFMSYSGCQNRFTAGQSTRMVQALLNQRTTLLSSLGGIAPPAVAMTAATCNPTGVTTPGTNSGPTLVTLNTLSWNSGGYASEGNVFYVDNTCHQGTYLKMGSNYNINVRTTSGTENVRVYIDYNDDGTFQAGELVFTHNGTINGTENHSGNIVIPTTGVTTCKPLRMRVVADRNTNPSITACGQLSHGQVEDYSVVVESAKPVGNIAITAGQNPSCSGSPLTFTASATPAVTSPSYQWQLNGTNVGTNSVTYSNAALTNGSVVRCIISYTSACTGLADTLQSNAITIVTGATATPTVTIAMTTGQNPSCTGSAITFTATGTTTGTAPVYQWKINGGNVGANSPTFTTSTITNGQIVTCQMTSNDPCASPTIVTSNSITVQRVSNLAAAVSIALTSGSNPTCSGAAVTFTATPTNGGPTPVYQWKINGGNVGTNSPTFTTTLLTGSNVTCQMTSSMSCATPNPATSNQINMTVNATTTASVNIMITQGAAVGCVNEQVTFTAFASNTGATPVYQWRINGNPAGTNSAIFTSTFADGDVITCDLTSSLPCVVPPTVTSNSISLIRYAVTAPEVTIAITNGGNPSCANAPITFDATLLNVGPNSEVRWYVNNSFMAIGQQFVSSTLANNDVVKAVVFTNNPCSSTNIDTSNLITINRLAPVAPAIGISIIDGNNPGCLDEEFIFQANIQNGGTNPVYTWRVNGVDMGVNNPIYNAGNLTTGSVVTCDLTSNYPCVTANVVVSNSILISLFPKAPTPFISYLAGVLNSDAPVGNQWYGPNGQAIPGANQSNYPTVQNGVYFVIANPNGCPSDTSNKLTILVNGIEQMDMTGIKAYPIPTTGKVTVEWGKITSAMQLKVYNVAGQQVSHNVSTMTDRAVIDLTGLSQGLYYVNLIDESGKQALIRIQVK